MRIMRDPGQTEPCVLVMGMFDGVHRGHQQLLMTGAELAERDGLPLYVCTYEPHPLAVLCPEKAPPMLTTLPERARYMTGFGVNTLCVLSFNHQVADQEPEDFVRHMVDVFHPRHVVVGFNNTFGRGGKGNGELMTRMGAALGFETHIVPAVELDGGTVSSTRIRGLLKQGDIHGANHLLGHAYSMSGRVMDGKHIGRTMGYPTANLDVPKNKALPAIWRVRVLHDGGGERISRRSERGSAPDAARGCGDGGGACLRRVSDALWQEGSLGFPRLPALRAEVRRCRRSQGPNPIRRKSSARILQGVEEAVRYSGGGGLSAKGPSPGPPPGKAAWGGRTLGRGRFSERSASPPRPPFPEERLAFGGAVPA